MIMLSSYFIKAVKMCKGWLLIFIIIILSIGYNLPRFFELEVQVGIIPKTYYFNVNKFQKLSQDPRQTNGTKVRINPLFIGIEE